jgi:hypothetical protein
MTPEKIDSPVLSKSSSQTAEDSIKSTEPAYAPPSKSIVNRLQAWVKSVEKDTETQVQEYLEQVDAGQSGE